MSLAIPPTGSPSTSTIPTSVTFSSHLANLYKPTPNLIVSSGTITFGTHTFTADQLGHLLSILLAQHPEVSL